MFSDSEKLRLVEAMRRSGITRLEIDCGEKDLLTLALPPACPDAAAPTVETATPTPVKSPGMGRFVAAGGDDGLGQVTVGDRIGAGQVLGYLELDGARLPVCAPTPGILRGDLPAEGQIIGFGDPLFTLEAEA